MSESIKEITEYRSVNSGIKGWIFCRFFVAFRELVNLGTVYDTGNFQGEYCRITMCLKGKLHLCEAGNNQKKEFSMNAGSCCLQYHPGHCPRLCCGYQNRTQVLEILCPTSELLPLVDGTRVGRELEKAMNDRRPLYIHQPMTPCIHQVIASLKEVVAKNEGAFASLILARALEMVWLFTQAWDSIYFSPIPIEIRQAVEKACSILESNIANPPALETLAAETGMSLSKLKLVFPRVCGVPPYTYLRRIRLERAMGLLAQKKMNVTETAQEVGYSSLSHFAKAFTAHYGIKPSGVASDKKI
jgi:AraC-like DNA-binding protein